VAANPACQQPQHQPHGGARVAAIEHIAWFLEAIKASALHGHWLAGLNRRYLHAHGPQAGGRTKRVLRWEQALDAGFSFGDSPKQKGSVGD
jgi:hypothetical protein